MMIRSDSMEDNVIVLIIKLLKVRRNLWQCELNIWFALIWKHLILESKGKENYLMKTICKEK